ncbi:hypothetical protein GCM10023088_45540 [Actinomadura verrucosospora]|uniref:hypothetical protein n=1 Tax=Actinomadura TaxID=1988 RepID=UPI0031EE3756
MNKRLLSLLALGTGGGALVGAVIQGLDYAVVLADMQHHGRDPMESGDFGYLGAKIITGILIGAGCGIFGACQRAFTAFDIADERKVTIHIAGGVVFTGVAACVASIVMAAFGLPLADVLDPIDDAGVRGAFSGICSYAAGILVVALDTDD